MWLSHSELNEHEQKLLDMSSEEFDKHMVSTYPKEFQMRPVEEDQKILNCMNFGFEIGKGWRHVLDSLCQKLEVIREKTGIVCIFTQIKEKFGSACFYHSVTVENDGTVPVQNAKVWFDIIDKLVNYAEEYTEYICEELGTDCHIQGRVKYSGWTYGMSVDGFKKWVEESEWMSEEDKAARLKNAEETTAMFKRKEAVKDYILYDMSVDVLEEIEKMVEEAKEEKKKSKEKK